MAIFSEGITNSHRSGNKQDVTFLLTSNIHKPNCHYKDDIAIKLFRYETGCCANKI